MRGEFPQFFRKPREGVWSAGDHEMPVTVLGVMGIAPDGVRYLMVEGYSAGIPEDQFRTNNSRTILFLPKFLKHHTESRLN